LRVIFACGGTGGHIYPAIAVAQELIKSDRKAKVLFVGTRDGMESRIVRAQGFDFEALEARPLIRKFTFENIFNAFHVIKSLFTALKVVKRFAPDAVLGTGGFASFPVVLAAAICGKRAVIHEPNMAPGLANIWLSGFASAVTLGFAETKKVFRGSNVFVTGNPHRDMPPLKRKAAAYGKFGLKAGSKTVLIMPGSRAARSINRAFAGVVADFKEKLKGVQFIWMTGDDDYAAAKEAVKKSGAKAAVLKFIDDAPLAYSIADAGIMRAGAGTLTEISAVALPCVLVPYPHATANHQEKNAAVFERLGAAVVIKDAGLTAETLCSAIAAVLDGNRARKMRLELKKIYSGNSAGEIVKILKGEAK
jgi:UDP-N-acetylglucosamine--N-acetylmuramyl-(pentapeptide) pyrophosphoryl-undecaprenol N-acetylglucosamine transferase